jgi:hypothetical protein
MKSINCLPLTLALITLCLGVSICPYGFAAELLENLIIRGYEGNGGVTVELARFGSPGKERALLRIQGTQSVTDGVLRHVDVQRSAVAISYVEHIGGLSRVIFEARMHQGFIPQPDDEPYVLGESSRIERLGTIAMEVRKMAIEASSKPQHAPQANASIIQNP